MATAGVAPNAELDVSEGRFNASVAELLLRPSPSLVILFCVVVLSGRSGETALAICLILSLQ